MEGLVSSARRSWPPFATRCTFVARTAAWDAFSTAGQTKCCRIVRFAGFLCSASPAITSAG